jgi:hypothetical protein
MRDALLLIWLKVIVKLNDVGEIIPVFFNPDWMISNRPHPRVLQGAILYHYRTSLYGAKTTVLATLADSDISVACTPARSSAEKLLAAHCSLTKNEQCFGVLLTHMDERSSPLPRVLEELQGRGQTEHLRYRVDFAIILQSFLSR